MKKKVIKKKKISEKEQEKLGLYPQAISFAAEQFRAGNSERKVITVLTQAYKKFTPENVQLILHKASQAIVGEYAKDRSSVVSLHTKRYNMEIEKYLNKKFDGYEPDLKRILQLDTYEKILDIMFAKERVLQIHNKETQVRIYNKLNAQVKEKKVMYATSKLSLEEKIEFLSLIQKAKRDQNELFGVQLRNPNAVETIDIEAEIIENDNINRIERFNERKEEEVLKPQVTMLDLKKMMEKNLEKIAQKEFEKAGSKIKK